MAKRIRAKLVLELLAKGMSGREIRSTRRISQRSIKLVREAAGRVGVTWEDVADMTYGEVYDLLFPAQAIAREAYSEPDWELVHSELQRDGVTLKLLWEEHRDGAARDGLVAKGYNTFCRGYKSWVAARGVTNHLEHKPGQVMEVDWNGTPMWLTTEDAFAKKGTFVTNGTRNMCLVPANRMSEVVRVTADGEQIWPELEEVAEDLSQLKEIVRQLGQ